MEATAEFHNCSHTENIHLRDAQSVLGDTATVEPTLKPTGHSGAGGRENTNSSLDSQQ